jgi:EAL domain-containing protein (putative c-di-GMP-specific phosphodiesterase class I)
MHRIQPLEEEISVAVTTSIGAVLFPEHGDDVDQLLANADIALYQAKARGRNAWHIFDGDDTHRARIHERVQWEKQIRNILAGDGIDMHYQPIMNLHSGQISHYEALLRCRDEQGELLPTAQLIVAAEQNGLIHRLDEQVISAVFRHAALLQEQDHCPQFAINLSGLSFTNPNLVAHIRNCLFKTGVSPDVIIFEITETAALADIDASIQIMEALRAEGCRFALDDFGVGFSSLYYLKKLPVSYIKIDGSFIRNLCQDSEHQVLIRALVDVARAFRLHTIAEFVESEDVVQLLTELGVDYAQGFHIARPTAFKDIWKQV